MESIEASVTLQTKASCKEGAQDFSMDHSIPVINENGPSHDSLTPSSGNEPLSGGLPIANGFNSEDHSAELMEERTEDMKGSDSQGSEAGAHMSQQAPAVLCSSANHTDYDLPGIEQGVNYVTPSSAGIIPLKPEMVLSQLGQFSSENLNFIISFSSKLIKERQQFLAPNFSMDCPIREKMGAKDRTHKDLQLCDPKYWNNSLSFDKSGFKHTQNLNFCLELPEKENLTISKGFKEANDKIDNIIQHGAKTSLKTFAQAAAPHTVSATIPTKGNTPECGLLVERLKNSTLDDYARALELVAGKKSLIFIGQSPENPNYVMAFLEKPVMVEKVVSLGITIKGKWVCVTHLFQPATKLIISDIPPYVSDQVILKACEAFGNPVYDTLRRVPSSVRAQEFKHLLSYRRELLIVLDETKQIPEQITVFSYNRIYKFGISTPGLVCHNCKRQGHKISSCKSPRYKPSENVGPGIQEHQSHSSTADSTARELPEEIRPWVGGLQAPIFNKEEWGKATDFASVSNPHNKGQDKPFNLSKPSPQENTTPKLPSQITDTNSATTEKKIGWQLVGKKGKTVPASNLQIVPAKDKLVKLKKTPKFDKTSDVVTTRYYNPPKDDQESYEGSADENPSCNSNTLIESKPGKRKNKKKMEEKLPSDVITAETANILKEKQVFPQSSKNETPKFRKDSSSSEMGYHAQIKKLKVQVQTIKSKHLRSELDLALPIIENLLTEIWALRASRRRSVLLKYQEKYPHLSNFLDVTISVIPSEMHGGQIYKSLMNMKQDIKTTSAADGRRSQDTKT